MLSRLQTNLSRYVGQFFWQMDMTEVKHKQFGGLLLQRGRGKRSNTLTIPTHCQQAATLPPLGYCLRPFSWNLHCLPLPVENTCAALGVYTLQKLLLFNDALIFLRLGSQRCRCGSDGQLNQARDASRNTRRLSWEYSCTDRLKNETY